MPALGSFIVLYALMYAAFGVASPYMPAFLESRGLAPSQLGIVLAAGTAVRLLAGPFAGRIADLMRALRAVLAACMLLAACVAMGLLPAHGFWMVLLVSLAHAAALAPTTTLADALALGAAAPRNGSPGFEYGWVRGTGSAVFILGTLLAGQVVSASGLSAIVWLQAGFLTAGAVAAFAVPELLKRSVAGVVRAQAAGSVRELLAIPLFRRVTLVAALILGSHAMHDGFAVMRWSAAGISPATASLLWSLSVAAEVLVFFLLGPWLLARIGPAGAAALAAAAAAVRWIVMAETADVAILVLIQPLHGITFALLHLACMRLIGVVVPERVAATAQALYGTVGIGIASAVMSLASGTLYERFGARGFFVMAALCVIALPLTRGLRHAENRPPAGP